MVTVYTYTNNKYYHFGYSMIMANNSNDLDTGTPQIEEKMHTTKLKTTSNVQSYSYIKNTLLEYIDQAIPINLTTPSKETHVVIVMEEQRETTQDAIKHSFLTDYIKSLQDQIGHLKSKVFFLSGELKQKNYGTIFERKLWNEQE